MSETFATMLRRLRGAMLVQVPIQPGNWSSRLVTASLSQNELARRAGVDAAYINRLERGSHAPSRAVVLALTAVLELDLAETDRLLFAAGLAPATDWQARAEAAEAKLGMIRQTLDVEPELVIFRRRTG